MMLVAVNRYILIIKGRRLYNKLFSKKKFIISIIAVSTLVITYMFIHRV